MLKQIFLYIFLVLSCSGYAQTEKQVFFRNLTVNNGLSQNSIVSMTQDHTGFMWFATQDGLNKYDGRQFIHFPYQFEDVTRNTYSKLGKVFVDNEDVVWIVTNSGNLHKKNIATKKFEPVKNLDNISVLIQDTSNNHYLATYGSGIYTITSKTKDTLQILKPSDIHLTTYDLFPYKNSVLAATSGGIIEIFENNSYQFIEVEPGTNFSSFTYSTAQNKLFLGSFGNGLFVSDDSMKFRPFSGFENAKLPHDLIIQDILVDSSDKLWVATYGKRSVFN